MNKIIKLFWFHGITSFVWINREIFVDSYSSIDDTIGIDSGDRRLLRCKCYKKQIIVLDAGYHLTSGSICLDFSKKRCRSLYFYDELRKISKSVYLQGCDSETINAVERLEEFEYDKERVLDETIMFALCFLLKVFLKVPSRALKKIYKFLVTDRAAFYIFDIATERKLALMCVMKKRKVPCCLARWICHEFVA